MQTVLQHPVGLSRTRAKRSLAWEEYEIQTNGIYAIRLKRIAQKYPMLTPSQLRVAALISGMKRSHEIATILRTTEHAVEKIRSRIRQRLGLAEGISLCTVLSAAVE
jgi:DNA-binding CsgD family transcriptional regulator